LRAFRAPEADAVLALLRFRRGEIPAATTLLVRAFEGYRVDPWPSAEVMGRALGLARTAGEQDAKSAAALFEVLMTSFSAANLEGARALSAVHLARVLDAFEAGAAPRFAHSPRHCARAFTALEPWPPYEMPLLAQRAACYGAANDARAQRAQRDLEEYLSNSTAPLLAELP
jgi:hypothetical protein